MKRINRVISKFTKRSKSKKSKETELQAPCPLSTGANFNGKTGELVLGKQNGFGFGGIAILKKTLEKLNLADAINSRLSLFKQRRGYSEADHVISIGMIPCLGGKTLQDFDEIRENDSLKKALGVEKLSDPTTMGDFCRRFTKESLNVLMNAINEVRTGVWRTQSKKFLSVARVDVDGTFVPTQGEKKEGIDYNGHKRGWGYHPLVVTLENTGEVLFLENREGNRPSHEGAADYLDRSIETCRKGGFQQILLRGDTDFSQTQHLDRWNAQDDVRFVFGFDNVKPLQEEADNLEPEDWQPLERPQAPETEPEMEREKRPNFKQEKVDEKGYTTIERVKEEVAQFDYQPGACEETYRIVVVRATLTHYKGQETLFNQHRYFFYITNLAEEEATPHEVVDEANQRCNQENKIANGKEMGALSAPLHDLVSNGAFMYMMFLGASFQAWYALLSDFGGKNSYERAARKVRVLTMEFRTFLRGFLAIPSTVIEKGRKVIIRMHAKTRFTDWITYSLSNSSTS